MTFEQLAKMPNEQQYVALYVATQQVSCDDYIAVTRTMLCNNETTVREIFDWCTERNRPIQLSKPEDKVGA